MDRKTEFLSKLRDLMAEYGAYISVEYGEGTDTHGITGEETVIEMQDRVVTGRYEEVLRVSGNGLISSDI